MHMCAAYLFDLAGDDIYATSFGASHAIGHDYGTAVMFDRAGSDIYVARDSRPGVGNANGLGLFIDASGEDRYQGPPSAGNAARPAVRRRKEPGRGNHRRAALAKQAVFR